MDENIKKVKKKKLANGISNTSAKFSQESSEQFFKLKVTIEFNLLVIILLILGVSTRFVYLESPRNIVFDEIHFGKYISLYTKQIFFFDFNPPLGKQLIALIAYLVGYEADFKFNKIGTIYPDQVPVFALRALPALCGSLIPTLAYFLARQLQFKQWSSFLLGVLIVYENSLLTQSKFILMESILLTFILISLITCQKFFNCFNHIKPKFASYIWLTLTCIFATCALCIKYIAIFSIFLILFLINYNFWKLIPNIAITKKQLFIRYLFQTLIISTISTICYLSIFYVHLNLLTKSGHHDSIMSSAFQASLEGGLASITKGQPVMIAHGSQITLRHSHGRTCWLHSHQTVYPIRYKDNRGSSHQQQVTCYSFKDVNNWWIVKKPNKNSLIVDEQLDIIQNGDIIQLVHGMSGRALNSHDVAAPMSPSMQEVSCYIDYNISMPAQNLWKVEIINKAENNNKWHAIESLIRLIHINSSQALKFSGKQLPEWGFYQHEIVTDKLIEQDDTVWNVEEHRYSKNDNEKEREKQLLNAEMIPTNRTYLTFWQKFFELQYKMLVTSTSSVTVDSHMYSSEPYEWPFLTRGVAYWVSSKSNAQVHLIGNIVIWYSATIMFLIYIILLIFYLMRRRRQFYDLSIIEWEKFTTIRNIFVVGYLLNFIPYFFMERTLFLHNYLIAYVLKLFVLVFMLEYFSIRLRCYAFKIFLITWITFVIYVFWKFSVLSYGLYPLTENDIKNLEWKKDWTLISHKNS